MFETLSLLTLQQYWWVLISLLGAILVFLMFVQGGQTMIYTLGKTADERTMIVNTLGRKWEFTFTTLVTFGGAFFASFPLFYSTSFGGAYWVWMIILFAFIFQAIAYEFRSKPNNIYGHKTYETFLLINGIIGTIFIGTAVATFFTGSPFSVNEYNQSRWDTNYHGLELALNFHNLSLGLAVFFLSRVLAILYFKNSINESQLINRFNKSLIINTIPFLFFFLTFVIWLFLRDGYAVDNNGVVSLQSYKYFINLIEMPIVLVMFLAGVVLVLSGIALTLFKNSDKGIWFSGAGTVLTVWALLLIAGLNNTSFYPSYSHIEDSLTIQNASSSHFTLTAMSYVSLFIPVVITYIWFVWKAINKNKIDSNEINSSESHIY